MCSLRLPESVFGLGGEDAIRSATADVAERSFFAIAEACDAPRFAELASAHHEWLVATVRFHEGPCEGEMSCVLPVALAVQLYDAFTGRDVGEPVPARAQLFDLIGEFANMICGGWLTRAAHETFSLNAPIVTSWSDGWVWGNAGRGMTLAIDDLPFLIDVDARLDADAGRPAGMPAATEVTQ